jgi:beta-galactosidase
VLAHYPQAAHFYELCDQAGLLVWAELPLVDCITGGPEFAANAKEQLIELVRQHYNHPSIFCWGLFNEMYHRKSAEFTPLLKELQTTCKQEDPARPTTGATNSRREDLCNVTDLLAFNAYPGWYAGGPDGMAKFMDTYNTVGKRRGIAVSEYGAGASIRQHQQNPPKPVPVSHWHPEEWQTLVHEANYANIRDCQYCWGSFLWNMFDFASAWRDEGDAPGMNDKGLVTYDRKVRKDVFYFYKANWSEEPVLYITSRRHVEREEAVTPVKVYANAQEVTLSVNGEKVGSKRVDDLKIARWDEVRLRPGENTIRVEALVNGKNVTDSCVWSLKPKATVGLKSSAAGGGS